MTEPQVRETVLKDNPYGIFCPECGKTICYVCEKIKDNINAEQDGYEWDRAYLRRQRRRLKIHLATYDHKYMGENDHSQLVMRVTL